MKWKPLHLFLYHKDDEVTRHNYEQLCRMEGIKNIQPISDCQSYLPKTYRADRGTWPFPHWDSYWMCDGLIYKYILNNIDKVKSSSVVVINEYDTWWQCRSADWMERIMKNCDIAASNILTFGKDNWVFFDKHKHLEFSNKLRGLVPFSVVCIKPNLAIEISKTVRDDSRFHSIYNNEMRIGSVANLLGAKIEPLPRHIGKNVQWHSCRYSEELGIYHPIKTKILPISNDVPKNNLKRVIKKIGENPKVKKSKKPLKIKNSSDVKNNSHKSIHEEDFGIVTCAFYGDHEKSLLQASRIKNSIERFGVKLNVAMGDPSHSLQDMKITRLKEVIKKMNCKWVMHVDCGDTYCTQDPRNAINYIKKCKKSILIGAELNCWPEGNLNTKYPNPEKINKSMSNYKYLNSGVFIGLKKNVLYHLDILQSMLDSDASLNEPWRTDQCIWTRLFLDQDRYQASVALDYNCEITASMYGMEMCKFSSSSRSGQPCIKMIPTSSKPIILHFNGNDKHDSKRIDYFINLSNMGSSNMQEERKEFKNKTDGGEFKRSIKKI